MEDDARQAALLHVANILQRPDQLEKLPEMRKRAERKKAAVEAMLRTGVQSQLEGIRTAMAQLHTAGEDIQAVENGVQAIRQRLKPFPALKEKMSALREANVRHGQYAAAMENLKNIFNINQSVQDARNELEDENGKMLFAHKHIMDLELARDELLYEVHKMNSANKEYEKNLLVSYFIKVDELVADLWRSMSIILLRALEMIKGSESGKGPQDLVSCLRIIEREERIDSYYVERKGKTGDFMPPGRPRRWRNKAFEALEKTVWNRVEGNQLEDRPSNKAWLARYLETCRRVMIEDLLLSKAAAPCFPPEYQIYERYVQMYHGCLCKRIREIASEPLEKGELVQLMSWIQSYGGEDLLGNPRLKLNAAALLEDRPVLSRTTFNLLCDNFIEMTRKDMKQWLEKTLSTEKDDWYKKECAIEQDNHGYSYTSLPNIIFGMLRDTVTLAKEVSVEVIPSIINLVIEEFHEFAIGYRDAFTAFKNKCFEESNLSLEFTGKIVAVVNNLYTCIESTERYMQQVRLSMESDTAGNARRGASRQSIIDNIDRLNARWNSSVTLAVGYLRDECCVFMDFALTHLFTRDAWHTGEGICSGLCTTIHNMNVDYSLMRPAARVHLMNELNYRIVSEYLKAIDTRRMTFSNYEERVRAAEILEDDVRQLDDEFDKIMQANDMMNEQFQSVTMILYDVASMIRLRDKSLLSLEVTAFARKYPNVPLDLLSSLVAIREDMGRTEARTFAEEILSHVQGHPKNPAFDRLFATQSETAWKPTVEMVNVLSAFMRKDFLTGNVNN